MSSEFSAPETVKSPPTVTSSGKPTVTLTSVPTLVTAVSISFAVPMICKSSVARLTSCVPESPSTVRLVVILAVVTLVNLPFASTVITGIAVAPP